MFLVTPLVSDKRICHVFPYIGLRKHVTPGMSHFWLKGYNFRKLGRGLLGDASYQMSRL